MRTARSLTASPYLVVSHACPPPPGATMHLPEQPRTPEQSRTLPPEQPCTPPRATTHPPVNRMTNWCKNITLPQTSLAGGNNDSPGRRP